MKVFLGGTCNGYEWRSELIPKLKCDYFNPVVDNWNEEAQLRELQERKTSDFVLYTITNDMAGIFSIAEVVDDSNKRPRKTIFCNLYKNKGNKETIQMSNSLFALEQLLRRNNVKVFHNLDDVANYLNLFCDNKE